MIDDTDSDFLSRLFGSGVMLALIAFAVCWVIPTMGVLLEVAHDL